MATSLATALANLSLPTQSDLSLVQTRSNLATNQTHGLMGKEIPIEGVSVSSLLSEHPLEESELHTADELLARLTASYKLDYYAEKSVHCIGAKDLFRRAVNKGWSSREFLERLDTMTETCLFPTWTPADFFKAGQDKLYPYSWVLAELEKDSTAMAKMEAYKVEGTDKPLWRYAVASGKQIAGLRRVVFRKASIVTALPEQKRLEPQLTAEQKETVDFALRLCEAEKEIERLQNQCGKYKKWWLQSVDEKNELSEQLAHAMQEGETV